MNARPQMLWLSLLVLAALVAPRALGALTYRLADYPADQNGHTLSGTITTDGTLGTLTIANVLDWQFTVTGSLSFSGVLSGYWEWFHGVEASATDLLLPATGGHVELRDPVEQSNLSWTRNPGKDDYWYSAWHSVYGQAWQTPDPAMGGTEPWIIATVPEPESVRVVALAALGLVLLRRARAWQLRPPG